MEPKKVSSDPIPPVTQLTGDAPDTKKFSGRQVTGSEKKSLRVINLTGNSLGAKELHSHETRAPDAKRPRISAASDNIQIEITGVSQATEMRSYNEDLVIFKQAWPDHVHIPSSQDGSCCYTTMENIVNFTQLINHQEYHHITGQVIAEKIKMAVTALIRNINLDEISQTDSDLQKEIKGLFHLSTMEEATTMLKDMNDRLEGYLELEEGANNLKPVFWGNTTMFHLMSICFGINIERYQIGTEAKSKNAGCPVNKKPFLVEHMTSNISDYEYIYCILEDYIQNNTGKALQPTLILACYHQHFDMWLNHYQAQTIRAKLKTLSGNRSSDPWQLKILQELRPEYTHSTSKRQVLFSRTF